MENWWLFNKYFVRECSVSCVIKGAITNSDFSLHAAGD